MVGLLRVLKADGYRFATPSVATHRRVLRRDAGDARGLRDVFGWSRTFEPSVVGPRLMDLMGRAGLLVDCGDRWRSAARVSTLGEDLFLHSAFPTTAQDAVFFGPDTYRFASFLREALMSKPSYGVIVDLGAGSGAGGIAAARHGAPSRLVLSDTNPKALVFAAANLRAAGLEGEVAQGDGLAGFAGRADLIVSNPPFIAGSGERTYRDGGDLHGTRLSLDWTCAAVEKLNPGGRLLLYTGSAIVAGEDVFRREVERRLAGADVTLAYREIDPDIFGDLLSRADYADAERIAAVGLSVTRRG